MKLHYFVISLFSLLSTIVLAQSPSIDQAISMKSVSNPKISPDGQWVAYTLTRTNWDENSYDTDIWLVNIQTGNRFQLTNSKKSNNSPAWSPDGKWLAFLSTRDDKPQLYLISPSGGEARAISKFETGVTAFRWSPNGKQIVFTATVPDAKPDKERKEKYSDYEVVRDDYKMVHLYLIDSLFNEKPASAKPLTRGKDFSVGNFVVSPDGKKIAYDAARNPDLINGHTSDLYVLTLGDTISRKIVSLKGPDQDPVWSPDGKQIAFVTANENEFYFYTNRLIATVPATGGTPTMLTNTFDENANLLDWTPDGILFSGYQKTSSHLFRLDPATQKTERLTKPDNLIATQFSFSKDGRQMAFVGAMPNTYAEIQTSSVQAFSPRTLTDMGAQVTPFKMSTREVISWKSADGNMIEGILIKPANYNPSQKYPLLVVIHGGPTGIDLPSITADRYYPVEQFTAKGALVLRPNYRGSAGYGGKFRALNVKNLGLGDYDDVITGVDYLISKGMVDKDKVGAMGWSQGGYISAFITTYSDRFKATSVGAGISNWATYYQNTDITPFTRQYLQGTPWDNAEIYQKTSPITYINRAKTPTLIQHGELDKRVPIANAYELRLALEDKGVPVKMVVYKGFGHGITKPKSMRQVMEENYRWFSKYIWGETFLSQN
ncbi:S9 family peptidase [Spirosoma linguale]|uniref:Peptidase S9 prolyl oligopeptidase active site domain protein n=1 Tax=Spirosoma linguale (strain ATCC 33905 / DSM 74 / LMG 10896 / Claus 1) TaxID=504472 RepID=D2QID6_SPILD|nr:peptidase S9 prolyl oligopeptidase active site domain protein [Spirosoma linguale DSM 74]